MFNNLSTSPSSNEQQLGSSHLTCVLKGGLLVLSVKKKVHAVSYKTHIASNHCPEINKS